ncbi:MAG TPA: dehydrogenase E1 component subunit alpha/beta [Bacteroidia bacterium]|jgi:2-oxoisovalerate dehydrogenase E1 component|nr:dehydrogenase E1 component subunit alpha/beta [Bacteroidia bacterium]
MITAETAIRYDRKKYNDNLLLELYTELLKPRMIEEKMLVLLRQGRISKWFSGIGQEAGSVGAAMALEKDEYILPMHRNLGVFTVRGIPFNRLFGQFQGKMSGFTKGRDRSFHFGTNEYHIVGMISHLGPQMGVADGIALANLLDKKNKVTLVYTGDGGASEGDFHESLNTAAVWNLPVIYAIENNGYGLSTPSSEQFRCKQFIDKGIGYGIEAVQVDGNNILEVYDTVRRLAESIRKNPRPVMLEFMTFRMRGHEEASGTKYIPQELFEIWGKKDPLNNFEKYLMEEGVLSGKRMEETRAAIKQEIDKGLELAFAEEIVHPDTEREYADVYKPFKQQTTGLEGNTTSRRMIDAISDGMRLAMQKHPKLVLMGQDIGEYGGAFKITDGFVKEFGKERVRNTPLCESAILGAGLGLSIKGFKAMVEMQFADFVTEGMTQIVNNLAKSHWRWGQNADVVVRMPTGAGVAAGPFHSQSNEAWFFHTPGLKIAYPAFPKDAKGLLLTAFEDPNPVMFFEHKALYRSYAQDVPDGYYTIEFGKANLIREGKDLSIITYGYGLHWAMEVLDKHKDISADLLDLRTLSPLDMDAVLNSVNKTGKVIVLHEDTLLGGIGGEIAAVISEKCFENLDAPVVRVASLDTPIPFSPELEQNFLPKDRFEKRLLELWKY